MTEPHDGDEGTPTGGDPAAGARPEDVGSVGEEAAKLLGAITDWAKDSGGDLGSGLGSSLTAGIGGLAGHAASSMADVNAHIATGAPECTYCPVSRTVHVIRSTSPEVKAHLATAASSLLQAVAGVLATLPPPSGSGTPGAGVERIDLDDDEDQDPT